jgi:hypothetical protein
LACLRPLLCCATSKRRREGDAWSSKVWGEHPSHCSLGCPLWFPLLQPLLGVSAASIIGGMGLLSLRQLAVTACWCGSSIFFYWALLVQVAAPAP